MAGHLLALEHLAGVLALSGRTVTAMAHRHAVARAQAAEAVALHRAGKALADRGAGHVHVLALDEMVSRDLGAHLDQIVGAHAKFGELALGLDIGDGKMAARGAAQALYLRPPGPELERGIAVLVRGPVAQHLPMFEPQHRHRDMLPGIGEDPGHADLLRDDT